MFNRLFLYSMDCVGLCWFVLDSMDCWRSCLDCWRVSCWRVRCLEGELLEVRCEHCLSLFPSCSCKLEDTQVVATVQSPVQ